MKAVIGSLVLLALTLGVQAQNDFEAKVDSSSFTFVARTAIPQGGGVRQLTGGTYDVSILPGKVVSYLPYFGRAYSANPGDEGGIKFTSQKFDYTVTKEKKGGRTVVIRPRDITSVQRLIFNISADGYASLQVISTNRQQISFTGEIK